MDTINERFLNFVKSSGLTQTQIGEKLMLSRAQISHLCRGHSNLTDRIISDVCTKFGVSEMWLRDGVGEMYVKRSRNEEIARMVNDILADDDESFRKRLIASLCSLSTEEWNVLQKIADGLLNP